MSATMISLLQQIEKLVPQCEGWCSVAKAHALAATVVALRPALTVEIGVWGGRSLLPMALAHKFIGKGQVIGIDPWSAQISAIDQPPGHREWWGKADHRAVYLGFLGMAQQLGLNTRVVVWKTPSDEATPPTNIDILHIDGSHCAQALRDAQRFAVNVRVGGILCLDDISGDETPKEWKENVGRAAEFCKSVGFVELYRMDTSAFYQRVK